MAYFWGFVCTLNERYALSRRFIIISIEEGSLIWPVYLSEKMHNDYHCSRFLPALWRLCTRHHLCLMRKHFMSVCVYLNITLLPSPPVLWWLMKVSLSDLLPSLPKFHVRLKHCWQIKMFQSSMSIPRRFQTKAARSSWILKAVGNALHMLVVPST